MKKVEKFAICEEFYGDRSMCPFNDVEMENKCFMLCGVEEEEVIDVMDLPTLSEYKDDEIYTIHDFEEDCGVQRENVPSKEELWIEILNTRCTPIFEDGTRPCDLGSPCDLLCQYDWEMNHKYALQLKKYGHDYSYYEKHGFLEEDGE